MRFALGVALVIGAAFAAACTESTEDVGSASSAVRALPLPASDLENLPGDLRGVAVPGIKDADLAPYVKDKAAAIRLGKALFWDMQVGSDGKTACASCHFRAGADPRSKNQMSRGPVAIGPAPKGTNYQLKASDFPLTTTAEPGVRGNVNANPGVVSSQGVHHLTLDEIDPNGFTKDGVNTRRVEPRNTPSVINAVFNHRQFWDGRAESTFNGVNHVGPRDASAFVLRANDARSNPAVAYVAIPNASLASQAVAPLLSTLEMAHPGRRMLDVAAALSKHARGQGRRIVNGRVRPLEKQVVSREDSVLGDLALAPARGLKVSSYDSMIADAFQPQWWDSKVVIRVNDVTGAYSFKTPGNPEDGYTDYTLAQYNWALIFGLAVQLYEETLVSDDTPWDRFRRENPTPVKPGANATQLEKDRYVAALAAFKAKLDPNTNPNPNHVSRQALIGAALFNDRTRGPTNVRCSNCHEAAEMTDASARRVNSATNGAVRNRDGNIVDKGFNNIGVRPTEEDVGAGGSDIFGPISRAKRQFPGAPPPAFDGGNITKGFGVEGSFKIPSLRNVALTAPYFHNGDAATLKQAVEFYSRGGNKFPVKQKDGTDIEPLGVPNLTDAEVDAIVAFLESLTDQRVLKREAPFDHPQLFVPNGHVDDQNTCVDKDGDGLADDDMIEIGAVGRNGGAPIPGFLEPGPFAGN